MINWLSDQAIRIGKRKPKPGKSDRAPIGLRAIQLRDLSDKGLTLSQAAREIGISPQCAHKIKRRSGITFRDGRRK